MEGLEIMKTFWQGKRVLITGHTGFKGSWLSLWLQMLGAKVIGYSLEMPSCPSMFHAAHVGDGMQSIKGDILDLSNLQRVLLEYQPDLLIHMAAQSLVRHSYQFPIKTLSTNIMGTANVLEAARHVDSLRVVVCVTSDKCYDNKEWVWGYRENEPMGGHDPYSASKGCAELVISSYRRSFLSFENTVKVASARAGNVIGGGDWAEDRLVPDIIQAFSQNKPMIIRNPLAIRPWQHVLKPLSGYLTLAESLWNSEDESYCSGWNFGPSDDAEITVGSLVENVAKLWGDSAEFRICTDQKQPHEARYLKLDCRKARSKLGWTPKLSLVDTLEWTLEWYKSYYQGLPVYPLTLQQINRYEKLLCDKR